MNQQVNDFHNKSQFRLLGQRRFAPFFFTQFLGAFNDNVFKQALIALIAFHTARELAVSSNTLINLAAGLFILPFFLFSATAGQLADKFEKSMLIRRIKILEICIMIFGAFAFYFENIPMLLGLLFLMGTQSSLFGPVKYSILPLNLDDDELVGGNGLVEMGTYLAILLGILTGTLVVGIPGTGTHVIAGLVIVLACLGFAMSCLIPRCPVNAPDLKINWNPFSEIWHTVRFARQDHVVFQSMFGISWFWFLGATYMAQLPNFTRYTLGGDDSVYTLLLTLFSIGIGTGSLLCERLSGHRVEIGLVPFGSIGLTLFGIDLFFNQPVLESGSALIGMGVFLADAQHWRVMVDILLLGMFGGLYIVPLYALIQQRTERSHVSRVIAAVNILNAFFMVISSVMAIGLLAAGLSIPQLLLITALMNAVVALYIYHMVPLFLVRFMIWLLMHTLYRISIRGEANLPDKGPAVLVCNHVSFVDALLLAGSIRTPVRFVMYHRIFNIPVLSFIFRTVKAIPIAPASEDEKLQQEAFDTIHEALAQGDLLVIFPEGRITEDGNIHDFRTGVERILERDPVPVYPVALRGMWGSFFSRFGGPAMTRPFRRIWSRVELVVGEAMLPHQATAARLQQKVEALRGEWK